MKFPKNKNQASTNNSPARTAIKYRTNQKETKYQRKNISKTSDTNMWINQH